MADGLFKEAKADDTALPTIPKGHFLLNRALDDGLRHTSGGAPRTDDKAHASAAFVAALGGAGLEIGEILRLCGCAIEAGPLLASCRIDFERPLRVDKTYLIATDIASLARKPSQRFGRADHLILRFGISADDHMFAAVSVHMIIPVLDS